MSSKTGLWISNFNELKGNHFMTMPKVKLKIKKLEHYKGELPAYQTALASGFDVRAQLMGGSLVLKPGERAMVATGLSFEIPPGYEIQSRPRSGLAAKHGISIVNTPGTIDADYRGEVKIILVNLGNEAFEIKDQERIGQLILAPVVQAQFEVVESLSETSRGEAGFGSTGR
jgi:dUTP pyrophosphatase